jgi:hypothetical protein
VRCWDILKREFYNDCFVFSNSFKIILFLFHFTPFVPNMEGHNLNISIIWKTKLKNFSDI